ncbi:MAG: acyltransferase [Lachnospiraceae bacterium]|nr:acyltransferase [Lachnospiraceae bacterium]
MNMNYLIYLVYPLMLLLLFWGAHVEKKGCFNEEAFSLRQMKALQGFTAVCIMLHHISQKTCANWLPSEIIIPGLELFVPYGYYFVGIFFFCSGYGLLKSLRTKPDYLKHLGSRRALPIVVAFYLTAWLFLLVRFLMKEDLNPWKVLWYASGLKLSDPNAWFAIILPFFYLFFWIAFRFCKKESTATLVLGILVLAYMILGTFIDHNDFWMRGEWWYNSTHFFILGVLFARHEERITLHLQKYYKLYFVLLLLAAILFDGFETYTSWRFSYYGENWYAPDKVPRRWACLTSQVLASCAFVFWVFLIQMKVRIGNWFLAFLGGITLEFYLLHGLFLELFAYDFCGVAPSLYHLRNVPLLVLIVFVPTLPCSVLLQKADGAICSLLTGASKKEKR